MAVLSLTWDENMGPTLLEVVELSNEQLLQELNDIGLEDIREFTRDLPVILESRGYTVQLLDHIDVNHVYLAEHMKSTPIDDWYED